jgi:hypothetical protein
VLGTEMKNYFGVILCHDRDVTAIFAGLPDFVAKTYQKRVKEIPNDHKIYQIATKYTKQP